MEELQEELNLGLYDYMARQYAPAIRRFTWVDPAADLMRRVSPYAYAVTGPHSIEQMRRTKYTLFPATIKL